MGYLPTLKKPLHFAQPTHLLTATEDGPMMLAGPLMDHG